MLGWAGVILVAGLVAMRGLEALAGGVPSPIGRGLFTLSLVVSAAMALTHWLCKRNGWR